MFRGTRRHGQTGRPHAGSLRLPQSQRPNEGHPVLCRDRTIPEDSTVRQEGQLPARLHLPDA